MPDQRITCWCKSGSPTWKTPFRSYRVDWRVRFGKLLKHWITLGNNRYMHIPHHCNTFMMCTGFTRDHYINIITPGTFFVFLVNMDSGDMFNAMLFYKKGSQIHRKLNIIIFRVYIYFKPHTVRLCANNTDSEPLAWETHIEVPSSITNMKVIMCTLVWIRNDMCKVGLMGGNMDTRSCMMSKYMENV